MQECIRWLYISETNPPKINKSDRKMNIYSIRVGNRCLFRPLPSETLFLLSDSIFYRELILHSIGIVNDMSNGWFMTTGSIFNWLKPSLTSTFYAVFFLFFYFERHKQKIKERNKVYTSTSCVLTESWSYKSWPDKCGVLDDSRKLWPDLWTPLYIDGNGIKVDQDE